MFSHKSPGSVIVLVEKPEPGEERNKHLYAKVTHESEKWGT